MKTPLKPTEGNLRILVVEDDERDLKLLCFVLRGDGHEVIEATCAEQVIKVLASQKPEVILMDLVLPDMDGLTLARQIKQASATAGIPIIAITSFPDLFPRGTATETGFTGYFTKPINTRTLCQKVAALAKQP